MQMTSIRPPAYEYVAKHGDLLRQLGAAKVEATDGFTINLTYFNNAAAVNAEGLLKDSVWGAKLVVDNQSLTADAPFVNAHCIAEVLRGVEGLEVGVLTPRFLPGHPGHPSLVVNASTEDAQLARLLQDLVETRPTPEIEVAVYHKPAAEPAG